MTKATEHLLQLANGTIINVLDEGTGPAIVLMHGWTADLHFWDDLAPRLVGAGWRVVRFDLRGHGRSPTQGPYPFTELSADLRHLLAALKLERPVLAGLSLGGFLAMIHAIEHPGTLAGIVLADTWTEPVPSDADIVATLPSSADGVAALAEWWARRGHGADLSDPAFIAKRDRFARNSADGLRHAIIACLERASVRAAIHQIDCPTLVIAGADETIFSVPMHQEMAAAIAGASMVVIEDAGHHSAADQPEEFAAAVGEFLASLPSRKAA